MNGRRAGARRLRWAGALAAALVGIGPALGQGTGQPAELPPQTYRGQQYVDTQGCVFLRAGTEAETIWVPRVTPGGKQLCGYPPSGNRVPVVGEAGAPGPFAPDAVEAAAPEPAPEPAPELAPEASPEASPAPAAASEAPQDTGSYVVAIGSFGFASNVTKAVAGAEALGYPVMTGQLKGGEKGLTTVFAGPFDGRAAADAALKALRKAGFPDALLIAL